MSDVMLIDNGLKEMHQMAKVICETLGVKTDIVANGQAAMNCISKRIKKKQHLHKIVIFDFTRPNTDELTLMTRMNELFESEK
jgi:CheY-like chemotaxis protein